MRILWIPPHWEYFDYHHIYNTDGGDENTVKFNVIIQGTIIILYTMWWDFLYSVKILAFDAVNMTSSILLHHLMPPNYGWHYRGQVNFSLKHLFVLGSGVIHCNFMTFQVRYLNDISHWMSGNLMRASRP